MRILSLITGTILVMLLCACEPHDRTPGTWLSGELVEARIDDWSFTDNHQEIYIETHPWYGIPFSVTVVVASANGKIYSPSIYAEPAPFPGSKYWNSVIAADPDVIVKIGDKRFPRKARPVTDPIEFEHAFEALASKYEFWRQAKDDPNKTPPFVLICMDDAS